MAEKIYFNFIHLLFNLKNASSLYQAGHKDVLTKAQELHDSMTPFWHVEKKLELLFLKDKLNINGEDYSDDRIASKLADYFYERGILSLTIDKDCETDDILNLFYILNKVAMGTFLIRHEEQRTAIEELHTLHLELIDFSQVDFAKTQAEQGNKNFDLLINNLLLKGFTAEKGEELEREVQAIESKNKADGFDANGSFDELKESLSIADEQIVENYKQTLKQKYTETQIDNSGKEDKQFFSMVAELLEDFSPDMQEEIVVATIEHFNEFKSEENLEKMLYNLPSDFVKRVFLEKFKSADQISPSLLKLMTAFQRNHLDTVEVVEYSDIEQSYKIDTLLYKEDDEQYLESNYNKMLRGFSRHNIAKIDVCQQLREVVLADLGDLRLNQRIIDGLIFSYRHCYDLEEKQTYIQPIKRVLNDALTYKDYSKLLETYQKLFLPRSAVSEQDKEINTVFASELFVQQLKDDFLSGQYDIKSIVLLMKEEIALYIDWLLELFLSGKGAYKLIKYLITVDTELTAEHALPFFLEYSNANDERLRDLKQLCEERLTQQDYVKLLHSEREEIRIEALEVLSKKANTEALEMLRSLLHSHKSEEFNCALNIIAHAKLNIMAKELTAMLPKFYFASEKMQIYTTVIKTLLCLKNSQVVVDFLAEFEKKLFGLPFGNFKQLRAIIREKK